MIVWTRINKMERNGTLRNRLEKRNRAVGCVHRRETWRNKSGEEWLHSGVTKMPERVADNQEILRDKVKEFTIVNEA